MLDDAEIRKMLDGAGFEDMETDDALIYEGALEDYAYDVALECDYIKEGTPSATYFDCEAFARDMILGGDVVELTDYRNDERSTRYFATNVSDAVWLLNPHDC